MCIQNEGENLNLLKQIINLVVFPKLHARGVTIEFCNVHAKCDNLW